MKTRQIGQKISSFGKTLGSKINHGIRTLGQKVYDNRYKLLAGVAGIASVTALGYAGKKIANDVANLPDPATLFQMANNIPVSRSRRPF